MDSTEIFAHVLPYLNAGGLIGLLAWMIFVQKQVTNQWRTAIDQAHANSKDLQDRIERQKAELMAETDRAARWEERHTKLEEKVRMLERENRRKDERIELLVADVLRLKQMLAMRQGKTVGAMETAMGVGELVAKEIGRATADAAAATAHPEPEANPVTPPTFDPKEGC